MMCWKLVVAWIVLLSVWVLVRYLLGDSDEEV